MILIQSNAFRSYLIERKVETNKIFYLPNSTEAFYKPEKKLDNYTNLFQPGFNLLFAGNIGEAQSFETLILAAKKVKKINPEIKWNILGEGRKKSEAMKMVADLNLSDVFFFHGSFVPEKMPFFFSCADVLIVSLKADLIFALTVPSKLQSYMACGKPIIASINGEGAKIIEDSNCGFVSASENVNALAENIIRMSLLPSSVLNKFGENALQYFNNEFDRLRLMNKFNNMLESII